MRFHKGRFSDYRGGGWYCSVTCIGKQWFSFLVALRWPMRIAFVKPDAKPQYRRLYVGPVEIEWSWFVKADAA